MGTELIIIRHGKTAWNLERRLQGTIDTELHSIGLRQAEALAERLGRERVNAVYSSDLKRAYQTAECIARRTRHSIQTHKGLRERNFGILQGLTIKEIEARYPQEWERFRRWDPDYVVPDGVSLREYYQAGIVCVEEIARRYPQGRVVIVTHGGILNGLLRHTLGIPFSVPSRFRRINTAINIFSIHRENWYLHSWGDMSHLRHTSSL